MVLRTPGLSQEATPSDETVLSWYGTINIPHYSKAVGLTNYMSLLRLYGSDY